MRHLSDRLSARPRAIWRQSLVILACIVVMHQFVMLLPVHEHGLPRSAHEAHAAVTTDGHECDVPCPPITLELCTAIVAVAPVVLAFTLVFALFALLAAPAVFVLPARFAPGGSFWPPDRRRAFLQVFLC